MKPINLHIPITLSDEDVIESLVGCDYQQIHNFICKVDLMVADVGFTEDLIVRLLESLKGEYKKEDWSDVVKEILDKI